jgi:uncharacterized protein with FMN-binding domain
MKPITKKITISAVVVIAFIGYAVEQYTKNSSTASVAATPESTQTTSNSSDLATIQTTAAYKDGSYTGNVADAFYGNLQAQVTIQNGKITNITYLQQPNDRGESVQVAANSLPKLRAEAIAAQSAQVDAVSGATQNSQAFVQTVQSALDQAKA